MWWVVRELDRKGIATDGLARSPEPIRRVCGTVPHAWEFDCHLFYRRSKHLALALGSQRRWKDALITRLEERNAA